MPGGERRAGVRFRDGGSEEPALPTGAAKTERVRSMFDAIAPRYDLVNRIMTLGLDQGWRRSTVASLGLPPGSVVLDLACGTGDLAALARRRGYRTIGVDLSWGMLTATRPGRAPQPPAPPHGGDPNPASGRAATQPTWAGSAPVAQCDAALLPLADASVDGVVCGYALRNFTDLAASLREAARVLRPGGRLAVLEVAEPPRGLLRAGHRIWFRHVVPAVGAVLSDRSAYRYLPRSTAYLPDEAALRRLLLEAGFSTVGRRLLHGGLSQLVTATRPGLPRAAPSRDSGGTP